MEVGNKCKISAKYLQNYDIWAKKHRDMRCEYHYSKKLKNSFEIERNDLCSTILKESLPYCVSLNCAGLNYDSLWTEFRNLLK